MAKRFNSENSISSILDEIIKNNKLEVGLNQVYIIESWKKLMGNGVNNYTRSVSLRNGILYVELSSSVLRDELSYGKQKIIKMINEDFGKDIIKDLVLR